MESFSHKNVDVQSVGNNQERSAVNFEWSGGSGCYAINGVPAPIPFSTGAMDIDDQEREKGSSHSIEVEETELFFRLFKFLNAKEKYMLEVHQVASGLTRFQVSLHGQNNNWNVDIEDLSAGDHIVTAMLQDPSPLIFKQKYRIPLEERLKGWTMKIKTRNNGKDDTETHIIGEGCS